MRSAWVLPCALLLGACNNGGIEFIVYPSHETKVDGTPSAPASTIRLYLGTSGVDGRIVADGFLGAEVPRGRYWDLDSVEDQKVTSQDQPLRFRYTPGDTATQVTAIAVGLDASGNPTSSVAEIDDDVLVDQVAVWRLGLNPAEPAKPTTPAYVLNQIQLWGPSSTSTTDTSCVHARTRRTDVDHDPLDMFIVTPGDRDCDGFPTGDPLECQASVFHGAVVPAQSTLSCLRKDVAAPALGTGKFCMIGAPHCRDGAPNNARCTLEVPFCAPQPLCDECAEDWGCATSLLSRHYFDKPTGTHITCTLNAAPTASGRLQICPGPAQLHVAAGAAGLVCTGQPMFLGTDSQGQGSPDWTSVWLGDATATNPAKLTFDNLTPACGMTVTGQGTVPTGDFPVGGLLSIQTSAIRGAVMPIEIKLLPVAGGCTNAAVMECTLDNPGTAIEPLVSCATMFPPTPL